MSPDLSVSADLSGRPAEHGGAVVAPVERPRRLRTTPALRRLVAQTRVCAADLVLPVFVREGIDEPTPIASMPGVVQHTRDSLRRAAHQAADAGVGGLMLFGVPTPEHKDAQGSWGTRPGC